MTKEGYHQYLISVVIDNTPNITTSEKIDTRCQPCSELNRRIIALRKAGHLTHTIAGFNLKD